MGFFAWVQMKVRNAVVAGFQQGLADVEHGDTEVDAIPFRLPEYLPAPEEPVANGRRRSR
jgi:hypothetical protein